MTIAAPRGPRCFDGPGRGSATNVLCSHFSYLCLEKSPTIDESFHLMAGYSHLRWGDFRINLEPPPLAFVGQLSCRNSAGGSPKFMSSMLESPHSLLTDDRAGTHAIRSESFKSIFPSFNKLARSSHRAVDEWRWELKQLTI
jgi:hypothetical protein